MPTLPQMIRRRRDQCEADADALREIAASSSDETLRVQARLYAEAFGAHGERLEEALALVRRDPADDPLYRDCAVGRLMEARRNRAAREAEDRADFAAEQRAEKWAAKAESEAMEKEMVDG